MATVYLMDDPNDTELYGSEGDETADAEDNTVICTDCNAIMTTANAGEQLPDGTFVFTSDRCNSCDELAYDDD
jgi:hypothetical protein